MHHRDDIHGISSIVSLIKDILLGLMLHGSGTLCVLAEGCGVYPPAWPVSVPDDDFLFDFLRDLGAGCIGFMLTYLVLKMATRKSDYLQGVS